MHKKELRVSMRDGDVGLWWNWFSSRVCCCCCCQYIQICHAGLAHVVELVCLPGLWLSPRRLSMADFVHSLTRLPSLSTSPSSNISKEIITSLSRQLGQNNIHLLRVILVNLEMSPFKKSPFIQMTNNLLTLHGIRFRPKLPTVPKLT